jgi:acyl-CoA synthetase (AMP-forming)/AMP-acid ligase II
LRIAEVLSSELQLGEETRMLAIAPLFHAGASTLSWGAQFRGGCVVLHRGFNAPDVVRTIERERITAIHLVPTMVQALLDEPVLDRHDLSSLRMLMYAAAPMPVPLLRRAVEKFGPITWNGYGQTEINLMTVLRPHQHVLDGDLAQVRRLASVGQPHWQSAVRIVASDGSECETGVIGEVVARSETAMAGYWRNEAATQETIRDGWVSTGDLGYLDEDGFLFLVDRKKDLIISGGENVYSREVEDALALHPDVLEAAVIGVPDPRWGEAVRAILVPRDPRVALDAVEVIGFCRTQIAAYKCPKSIETIDALPRLNTGKVDKNALRARFGTPP